MKDYVHFYHPNITGHEEIGKLVYEKIGVPSSARDKESYARPIDLTFVVESSDDTKAKLPEIKKQMRRIAQQTFDAAKENGNENPQRIPVSVWLPTATHSHLPVLTHLHR